MAEEKSLDLSQVSVANLLNNDAPTSIPEPEESVESEVTEETPEPEVEQEAAVQEEPEGAPTGFSRDPQRLQDL